MLFNIYKANFYLLNNVSLDGFVGLTFSLVLNINIFLQLFATINNAVTNIFLNKRFSIFMTISCVCIPRSRIIWLKDINTLKVLITYFNIAFLQDFANLYFYQLC